MKWSEFINEPKWIITNTVPTEIECPKCGKPLYRRTDIVLTSLPPKYQYECLSCDFVGYA